MDLVGAIFAILAAGCIVFGDVKTHPEHYDSIKAGKVTAAEIECFPIPAPCRKY